MRFYFDEHMPRIVARALTDRGHQVIMAVDMDMIGKDDDTEHLPFATSQGAVLFTRDRPFAGRAIHLSDHAGVICWTGVDDDRRGMIRALIGFTESYTQEEAKGRVFWLK